MKKLCYIIFLLTAVIACTSENNQEEQAAIELPSELPDGFIDFYQRFLSDSAYQMEHILFPLQGLPSRADSATITQNTFRWQMEDWTMHRPIDAESGFSVNIQPLTEDLILEKVRHESGQYGMERRFAFLDDGWYLVYYAGLNAL